MGMMVHRSIIITDWDEKRLKKLRAEATDRFGQLVSPVMSGICNAYDSFFIAPCGSNVGWEDAEMHNDNIDKFREILTSDKYNGVEFVIVRYGELDIEVEHHD